MANIWFQEFFESLFRHALLRTYLGCHLVEVTESNLLVFVKSMSIQPNLIVKARLSRPPASAVSYPGVAQPFARSLPLPPLSITMEKDGDHGCAREDGAAPCRVQSPALLRAAADGVPLLRRRFHDAPRPARAGAEHRVGREREGGQGSRRPAAQNRRLLGWCPCILGLIGYLH